MKRQKDRVTAAQFDQALLEQIEHYRNTNVSANQLASVATFAELLGRRLFGTRGPAKRTAGFTECFNKLIGDAKVERYEARERERAATEAAKRSVLMPGDPGFGGPPGRSNPRGN
jgi:hypothetical protein